MHKINDKYYLSFEDLETLNLDYPPKGTKILVCTDYYFQEYEHHYCFEKIDETAWKGVYVYPYSATNFIETYRKRFQPNRVFVEFSKNTFQYVQN